MGKKKASQAGSACSAHCQPYFARSRPNSRNRATGPASPHAAHANAPPRLRLLSLPPGPTRQPHTVHRIVFLPRPLTSIPFSDRAPTALAGAGQGVTPGAWPCPHGAAPTQPLAAVGCSTRLRSHLIPQLPITGLAIPPLGYKSPGLGCPSTRPIAPPPLGGQPLHTESRRLRRRSGEEGGAAAGRRTGSTPGFRAPPRIKPGRTTLHGTASGATRPQLVTAPPSSLPQHPR